MGKLFIQFLKFGTVGVINTGVDLVVLTILIAIFPAGHSGYLYSLFKITSFTTAVLNSYWLNSHWTFKGESGNKGKGVEFSQFLMVSLVGAVINVTVASIVNNHVTAPGALTAYWPQISALTATAIGLFWNFLGYKVIVFDKKTA